MTALLGLVCIAAGVLLTFKVVTWLTRLVRPAPPKASFTVTISTTTTTRSRRKDDARWFGPGEAASVAGHVLPGGLLYVGSHLNPIAGYREVEPAMINPMLPVGSSIDWSGETMTYWPSYSDIRPECRGAYLRWLADGRRDPTVGIGYVFLFFYGLERRLLHDDPSSMVSSAEREAIAAEVARLLDLYGAQLSFRRYAGEFLTVARVLAGTRKFSDGAPPSVDGSFDIPLAVRIGLAEMVATGRPIPTPWALAWVRFHPDTHLRTPAQRCLKEFEKLFEIRYHERFGDGMVIKPNRTKLVARYKPASASFSGAVGVPLGDLSDITALTAPVQKLRELADGCADDLEAYSRRLGREPAARGTVAATALLPPELASQEAAGEADTFFQFVRGRMLEKDWATVDAKDILACWPTANADGRLDKPEAVTLGLFLQRCGYAVEPDVRFGGRLPKPSETVVLFRLPPNAPAAPSPQFRSAAALLHMAVLVAQADGTIDPTEEARLATHLESALQLDPAERLRLQAHLRWQMANRPSVAAVKKKVAHLDPAKREALGQFLVGVAAADGRLDRKEVQVLTKLYALLGLAEESLFADLHSLGVDDARPSAKPMGAGASQVLKLDPARVQAKIAESAAVAALLQDIFTEDETSAPGVSLAAVGSTSSLTGLDPAHSAFVRDLAVQTTWVRADLESLASRVGLMPDGAVEVVNERAFDVCGEPLFEGEDPIVMNPVVLKELMA